MKNIRNLSLSRGIFGALIALSFLACEDGGDLTPASAQNASLSGCTAEDRDLGSLSCELGLSVQEVAPALQDGLRQVLTSYAHALQRGDTAAVEALLSAELQVRIHERGQGADFTSKLQDFVQDERRKLSRSVGVLDASPAPMTITSARMLADGSIAALRVAVAGKPLPKPFYFVQEDGSYKLNIIRPSTGYATQSSYLVANGDYETREFSCAGTGPKTIAATPATMFVACQDSCPGYWDGTRFTTSKGSSDCDWNAWGADMTIKNGYPVCNDRC